MSQEQPSSQENTSPGKGAQLFWLGILLSGLLIMGIVVLLNLRETLRAQPTPTLPPDRPGVLLIDPPRELTSFTLPANSGVEMSLSDLAGRYTLLFFGYTYCPDFCPLTLTKFRQIKSILGEQGEAINYVFVSVDPARDTPERLSQYIRRFDPAFIGLSGVQETLAQIAPDYGLYWELRTGEGENYPVDHSTASYLIDDQGRLAAIFTFEAAVNDIAETIREALAA